MEEDTFDVNNPLFREPPEEMESDWYHGFLLGGMIAYGEFEVARSYRKAGDAVIAAAINNADLSHEWVYPPDAQEAATQLVIRQAELMANGIFENGN